MNDSSPEGAVDRLTCALPLALLTQIAARLDATTFALLLKPIFGGDLAPSLFVRLRKALLDNTLESPALRVQDDVEQTCAFDSRTQAIEVSRQALDLALKQPEQCAGLLIALLGTFSLYIDATVRRYLAEGQSHDAPPAPLQRPAHLSEHFTHFLLFYADPVAPGTVLAHYTRAGNEHALVLAEHAPLSEDTVDFGSGLGDENDDNSFGHESIEQVLKDVGFSEEDCRRIYFGNWLRDHSQVLDPKIIRAPSDASGWAVLLELLTAPQPKLTRQQLTAMIDLLALKQFHTLQRTAQGRQAYKVDTTMLGVYRAFEHIDNPTTLDRNASNPKQIDVDFQALVFPEDSSNNILCKSSMKQYIRRPIAFMKNKLQAAMKAGQTPEGMRYFGEALHVLEDYLAHSNFVELSLKKQGHDRVLVWTPRVESRAESNHEWPVITGMFSTLDVLGSVIDPLANALLPTYDKHESYDPGQRKAHQQAILILLDDGEGSTALTMYKAYLKALEQIENNWLYRLLRKVQKPMQSLRYALNKVKKPLLKLFGDQIANLQVYLDHDPNTDPSVMATHSQLSKDHDTHPYHTLAVELARHAVKLVGQAMYEHWQGTENAASPWKVARKLIRHPNDCTWQETIVRQWAEEHSDKVEQGTSLETLRRLQTTELNRVHGEIENALQDMEDYFAEIEQLTDTRFWQIATAPPSLSHYADVH